MNRILYADSETNADLYYATRFLAGDPFLYVERAGRRMLVVGDLEFGRAHREARVDEIVSTSDLARRGAKTTVEQIVRLLRGARRAAVPSNFPVNLADQLRAKGVRLDVRPLPFWDDRPVKTPAEVREIERAQRATEEAFDEALAILRRAKVRGDRLYHRGSVVTSESLRQTIHRALLDRECSAKGTIVSCGDQGCVPHFHGTGPIRPNRTIVFDIFPRSETSRYFADMSRTVLKGRATDAVRRLYDAVREGQELGISQVRAGVNGRDVDAAIRRRFEELGYETERRGKGWVGYFHGTGHGVGLDIHEAPWLLRTRDSVLPAGAVVTVEPGLYYPGVGAVRLEDMVLVTKTGCRNLTKFPKVLEVK